MDMMLKYIHILSLIYHIYIIYEYKYMTYNIIISYDVISLIIFIKLCQKKLNIFFRVESCNKIQWGLKLLHDTYICIK